jgi:hypothetical protein
VIQESAPAARRHYRLMQWPKGLGWLAVASGLPVVIAILVAQGRTKTWFALVALSAAFILANLERATRFKVLLLAVLTAPLLFGAAVPIPLELMLSQSLLIFVVAAEMLAAYSSGRATTTASVLGARYYVPFALFALLGLVSTYINGELFSYWPRVCLVPLLLLFAIDRLSRDEAHAMTLIKAAVAAILAFVGIVWVAQATGHALGSGSQFAERFAGSGAISLGPLSFQVYSITVGSLAAMGLPAALLFAVGARSRYARWMYVAMVLTFAAVLGFTAARGAIIGAVVGTVLALFVSRRITVARALFGLVVLAVVLAVAGPWLMGLFPSQGVARVAELRGGLGSITTFRYRLDVWNVTVAGIMSHPLGPGFGYLWNQYGLDEALVYSIILNGTGLMGLCALLVMLFQLARGFLSGLLSRVVGPSADLAAIGLGTMAAALLAGVSSESPLIEPVHTLVFWTIMAAAATGVARSRTTALEAGSSGRGDSANG